MVAPRGASSSLEAVPADASDGPSGRATDDVLREVNVACGSSYALLRPLVGGVQSGAWLIQDEAQNVAVLKWTPERSWAGQVQRADQAVAAARRHGYPTPAWLAVGTTRQGYAYQVQEHVGGRSLEYLSVRVAGGLVDLLESQAGLDPDPGRSWSTYVTESFTQWPSTCAAASATGSESARLVDEGVRLMNRYEPPVLPSHDLVHGDFRLSNILWAGDQVSGVIDIEALGSGSRVFDYATLLDHEAADEAAIELLVAAGARVAGPAALAWCLVHVCLDLVLFMARRRSARKAAEVEQRSRALRERVELVARLLIAER